MVKTATIFVQIINSILNKNNYIYLQENLSLKNFNYASVYGALNN